MLFYTTRFILFAAIACLLIVLIHRFALKRKRVAYILAVFIAAALTGISVVAPLENLLVHFDSAESVFSYYVGKGTIQAVLDGCDSCMIVSSGHGKLGGQLLLPKEGNRYLVPTPATTQKVASSHADRPVFYDVYSARGTEDYYVFGYLVSDTPSVEIADSAGKPLQTIVQPSADPTIMYVTFFGRIEGDQADYDITVNGDRVPAE